MAQATLPVETSDEIRDMRTHRAAWVRTLIDFARTYPYLLPAIIFFVGWQIWPIYESLRISFTE